MPGPPVPDSTAWQGHKQLGQEIAFPRMWPVLALGRLEAAVPLDVPVDLFDSYVEFRLYVGTFHDDKGGILGGENSILCCNVDGVKVGHSGDIGHVP